MDRDQVEDQHSATLQAILDALAEAWDVYGGSNAGLIVATPVTIVTHTALDVERLRRVVVSANRHTDWEVHVNGAVVVTARTTSDAPTCILDLGNGVEVPSGQDVDVVATNRSDQGLSSGNATLLVST